MTHEITAPLKLAFIGGAIDSAVGYTHFCASRMDGAFEIVAGAFSQEQSSNNASAARYGVSPERTYSNWQELLVREKGSIDAVAVLTPIPDHVEMVSAALLAGFPVICEKPLAVSSAECERIEAVLESTRGYLAVTYNYSGFPMVRELRRMLRECELGEIRHAHIEMPQDAYLRPDASPQQWRLQDYDIPTVSLDLGAHVFHMMQFLTGCSAPVSMQGREATHGRFPELVDTVSCLACFAGGVELNAWWSKAALGASNGLRVRIYGSEGSADWLQTEPEYLNVAGLDGAVRRIDRSCSAVQVANADRYNRFKAGHTAGFIEAFANVYSDIAGQLREHVRGEVPDAEYVCGIQHSMDCLRFLESVSAAARTAAGKE